MKKIFVTFVLLLTLVINSHASAAELLLYSQDGFDIKSDSYIQDEAKQISFVKGSNIILTYTNDKDFVDMATDPRVDVNITKKGTTESVFSLSSANKKIIKPEDAGFDEYLNVNKTYFEMVSIFNNKVQVKVPLNFVGGNYDISLVVNDGTRKIPLNYSFTVSNSSYNFTNTDLIIEDTNVLANIGYISLLGKDQDNKVVVTLTQGTNELFKKEFDKKFYNEGVITVDEDVQALKGIGGKAELKLQILDADGSVLLSQSKMVDLVKTSNKSLYYIIIAVLILLLVGFYFIIKPRKAKVVMSAAIILVMGLTALVGSPVRAIEMCGDQPKPDDICQEGQKITHVCEITDNCSGDSGTGMGVAFSTGNSINVAGPQVSGTTGLFQRPASSADVDICSSNPTLAAGGSFYVISDSSGSDWERKKYHIFSFTKGKKSTVTYTPKGASRNVNKAVYDGSCNVTVSSQYAGGFTTQYSKSQVAAIETGVVTGDMCRSKTVNDDVYENNTDLMERQTCADDGTKNTYIGGSVRMSPIQNAQNSWKDTTVNVCTYLNMSSSDIAAYKAQGKSFYALTKLTAVWTYMTWPVFQFQWGVPLGNIPEVVKQHTGDNAADWIWFYNAKKENAPSMSYDGQCTLTFRLYNYGHDTDAWQSGYQLVELGKVENATCKDPILVAPAPNAYYNANIEKTAKTKKYGNIAPFFLGLGACSTQSECKFDYNWIESATDQSCVPTPDCSCSGRTEICTTEGGATTTTPNSPQCVLKASCAAVVDDTGSSTVFTITPENGIGNITYTNGSSSVTQNNTDPYISSVQRKAGIQSILVQMTDAFDGSSVNSSCYINTSKVPAKPKISLGKSPAVTLNKNGQCTISWDIQNMPDGASCRLVGFGIDQVVTGKNSYTSGPLTSNQKYMLTCAGEGLDKPLESSVICRVNPDVKEN